MPNASAVRRRDAYHKPVTRQTVEFIMPAPNMPNEWVDRAARLAPTQPQSVGR